MANNNSVSSCELEAIAVSDGEVNGSSTTLSGGCSKHGDSTNSLKTSPNAELLPCNLCGKAFGKASSLEQHMHFHNNSTSTKTLMCVLCLRTYAQYPNLCRHWKINHRVEHDILRKINVAVPRSVWATSRGVRGDQFSSNFPPDASGLTRNWTFPAPTHAMASDSHLTMPFPLFGTNYILGNNVPRVPFNETNISGNALTGTKFPAAAQTGSMFPSASITGYPAFPGLTTGGSMQFPSAFEVASDSHLATPTPLYRANCIFGNNVPRASFTETKISGNALTGTKIPTAAHTGSMFPRATIAGYPTFPGLTASGSMQFPSAFSGIALNTPMNYRHLNHALPTGPWLDYAMPFGSAFPLLGLRPPTRLFNSYPAPWSMPHISKKSETQKKKTSRLQKDGHPIKVEFKVTAETPTLPATVVDSPESSAALEKKDHPERPIPSGMPSGTE